MLFPHDKVCIPAEAEPIKVKLLLPVEVIVFIVQLE
jgi:hypothetical protein